MQGMRLIAALFAYSFLLASSASAGVDCQVSSCSTADGSFPKEVCRPIWGMCPKPSSPLKPFAVPCKPITVYNKCSTLVDCTADDKGDPKWARKNGSGAAGRTNNSTGAGTNIPLAELRVFGDDPLKQGASEKGRTAAYPPIMKKGKNFCNWWAEAVHHATSTLAAAGRCPGTVDSECKPGTPRLYAAVPSVICQSLEKMAQPNPMALASTYTGEKSEPGTLLAASVARNSLDPSVTRPLSGFADPTKVRRIGQEASFKAPDWSGAGNTGRNLFYDRGPNNPTILASDKLFLKTLAYDVYDPSKQDLAAERKLALELAAKSPQEVAKIREEKGGWLDAYAAGTGSDGSDGLHGIMCKLRPDTCQFTSHFDRGGKIFESYFTGMARDNAISTPDIKFLPGLAEQFPGLLSQIQAIGGKLAQNMFSGLFENNGSGGAALSRNDYLRCLNAMRTPAINGNRQELLTKANTINANCPAPLTSCLQAQGGYSEASLNICYLNFNVAANSNQRSNPNSNPNLSAVASFLFNGNPQIHINGLSALNLDSLASADIPQLNDLIMQRIPNIPKIGGLLGNAGQFFGNLGSMPKTIADMKSNPYIQSFFGENQFDMRAMLNMFPERDHYSPCTSEKTCYVSKNEAPLSFFKPWYKGKRSAPAPSNSQYQNAIDAAEKDAKDPDNSSDCFGPSCSDKAIGIEPPMFNLPTLPNIELNLQNRSINISNLSGSTREMIGQIKHYYQAYRGEITDLDDASNPDSPLNFGPNPSHIAIGMPETNMETGPLIFREDGSVYYANKPDEKVNYISKNFYSKEDVEKGYLPKEFANFVPENAMQPWDRLALLVNENGGIAFMPPEKINAMVAKINKSFRDSGSSAYITASIFRQSAVDFVENKGQNMAEAQGKPSAANKVSNLLEHFGLSEAYAASVRGPKLPSGAQTSNGIGPPSRSQITDAVRCAGHLAQNQIRVDVLAPRYPRLNGQLLQRIVYNRWAYADGQDKGRCTPGHVCAPKPCPGGMSAWSKACWAPTHRKWLGFFCRFPAIQVGPSDEFPLSAVRYDYGAPRKDIAHFRKINNFCGKIPSPLYKKARGGCHFNDRICRQTRAYNCRTYAGGERLCGYTWAFHPDVKYILMKWASEMGGDFNWDVGERHMKDECEALAAGVPLANKHIFSPMEDAAKAGIQIPEGSSFAGNFGPRMPHIINDATGLIFGQKPGQPIDLTSAKGAYVFINNSDINAKELTQMAKATPLPSKPKSMIATLLNHYAPAANAASATRGNAGSAMACAGGSAGLKGANCPKFNGVDPQSQALQKMMQQVKTVRNYGLNCRPKENVIWADSAMAMYAEMGGANVSRMLKNDGDKKGILRTITYPETARQNFMHPEGWNGTGGAERFEEKTGGKAALALGDKAGGSIITFPDGMGEGQANGPDSHVSPPVLAVVTNVNETNGSISAYVNNVGGDYDAAMQTMSSARVERTFYKKGKMPSVMVKSFKAEFGFEPYCYKTRPEQSRACILTDEDWNKRMRVFYRKDKK